MIEHALAHHLGGMRGEHRHDQRGVQQGSGSRAVPTPSEASRFNASATSSPAWRSARLSILGKVREHGEQHEPADEGQGLVQAERLEPAIDRGGPRDPAEAIDRRGPDVLDALEQRVAAVGADDVAEQLSEGAGCPRSV